MNIPLSTYVKLHRSSLYAIESRVLPRSLIQENDPMRRTFVTGSAALLVLFVGSTFAADDFKSGPQKASMKIKPFNPTHCSGSDAGSKDCLT